MEFFFEKSREHHLQSESEFKGNIDGQSWEKIHRNMRNTLQLGNYSHSSTIIGPRDKISSNFNKKANNLAKCRSRTFLAGACTSFPLKNTNIHPKASTGSFQPDRVKQVLPQLKGLRLKKRCLTENKKHDDEQESSSYQQTTEFLELEMRKARKYYPYSFHESLFKHRRKLKEDSRDKKKSMRIEKCKQNIKVYTKSTLQETKKIHSKPFNISPSKKLSPAKNIINYPKRQSMHKNILRVIPLRPTKHLFL